jgi:ammonia channel protein AmtB
MPEAGPNSGDTAWILISTALVLFMTIPGLALFYGGLVRTKNVLSVLVQCFALTGLVTLLWLVCGYGLAFDATGMEAGKVGLASFVGGLSKAFLIGVDGSTLFGSIPEVLFFSFQMTFAIITPGLVVGGFVGTLLVAFFASGALGGNQGDLAVGRQFAVQLGAALGVAAYTAVTTWAILKAMDATLGLRVADQQESQGLDLALHDEAGYRL